MRPSDTEMLNWLQQKTNLKAYSGSVNFDWSPNSGWVLGETRNTSPSFTNVRDAIHYAMVEEEYKLKEIKENNKKPPQQMEFVFDDE